MHLLECDVVVVGAGPAGSLAARSAAEMDSNVILIEEHGKVGYPIYCAEGLSLAGIEDAGIKPEPPIVSQEITKARVFAPNQNYIELTSADWKGFTLNRDEFDQALAEKAIESGAELLTSTKATTVLRDGARIIGIQAEVEGEPLKILSKVVIGADGHASIIRRTAGLGKYFPDFVTCAQYRLGGIELEEPWVIEIYLGSEVSPGGYAWVFPKSTSVANVGLGVRRIHKEAPINYLNKFIASDSRFKDAEIMLVNGGICPISGSTMEESRGTTVTAGNSSRPRAR